MLKPPLPSPSSTRPSLESCSLVLRLRPRQCRPLPPQLFNVHRRPLLLTSTRRLRLVRIEMTDRNARLAALAARAGRNQQPAKSIGDGNGDDLGAVDTSKPTISFRNYVPKDASLDASTAPIPEGETSGRQPPKRQRKNIASGESSAEPKSALELALAKTSHESREAAGQNIGAGGWVKVTPVTAQKVNWDLKRDIQHKMDKLERRTQRAIVDLLRERLEREAAEGGDGEDDSDLD